MMDPNTRLEQDFVRGRKPRGPASLTTEDDITSKLGILKLPSSSPGQGPRQFLFLIYSSLVVLRKLLRCRSDALWVASQCNVHGCEYREA